MRAIKSAMVLSISAFALVGASANAATTVFDFESIALGSYSTASQTVGGLTVALQGSTTNFTVEQGPTGGNFGARSILSFRDRGGSPVIATFSSLVSSVTLFGTDFTPSDADRVWFQAFSGANGTGTLLGTATGLVCCNTNSFPAGSASLSAAGIKSIVFWEAPGDDFRGALLFDNLTVNTNGAVPEPATWALMIGGFGAIGGTMRYRRRKTSVSFA